MCRLAPRAALTAWIAPIAVLALAGCFDSHGAGTSTCDCCGVRVEVPAGESCTAGACDPYCGIVPPDGGPLPSDGGAPSCVATRAPIDLACVSHPRAGRPTELPVLIGGTDGCFCDEEVTCSARVEGPRTIALETGICEAPSACEACMPFVGGTCALPALEAGTWRVRVNGTDAMELEVLPPDVVPERADVCTRRADDGGGCGNVFPPHPFDVGRVCHPEGAYPGERVPIRVTDACGSCGRLAGPCVVSVLGDVIHVRAQGVGSGCDVDCPPVCIPREDVCWTPPLATGTWHVLVEGFPMTDDRTATTITVGGGAISSDETCVGALITG